MQSSCGLIPNWRTCSKIIHSLKKCRTSSCAILPYRIEFLNIINLTHKESSWTSSLDFCLSNLHVGSRSCGLNSSMSSSGSPWDHRQPKEGQVHLPLFIASFIVWQIMGSYGASLTGDLKSALTDWAPSVAPSRSMLRGFPLHRPWNCRSAVMPGEPRDIIYKTQDTLGGKNFQTADTCGKNTTKHLWWHLLGNAKFIALGGATR